MVFLFIITLLKYLLYPMYFYKYQYCLPFFMFNFYPFFNFFEHPYHYTINYHVIKNFKEKSPIYLYSYLYPIFFKHLFKSYF